MKKYKNSSGNSGVVKYEIKKDGILIEFEDGGLYLYDHCKPGSDTVQAMLGLAEAGRGLATFIKKFVRDNYAKKLR